MDWSLLVLPVLVLWITSICKMLHTSFFPSNAACFNNGDSLRKKFLLVIAHPDDESMFFTPTINYLTSRGHHICILCLSTGNADGMGKTRRDELYKACSTLKVPPKQVEVLDHPELQDGFGNKWNHSLIARIVNDTIASHGIRKIITFDSYGVSGHCNHQDVNHGIRKLLLDSQQSDVEAWELISTNLLRKYSGPVDIWLSTYVNWHHSGRQLLCLINEHPLRSFQAMAQHMSQWVWTMVYHFALSSIGRSIRVTLFHGSLSSAALQLE